MPAPQTDPNAARLHGASVPGPTGLRGPGAPRSPQVPARTPGTTGLNDAAAKANGTKVDNGKCVNHDGVAYPRPSALAQYKLNEGYANYLYLDTSSYITIGVGWNLEAGGGADKAPQAALDLPFLERKTGKPPADPAKSVQEAWSALHKISPSGSAQAHTAGYFKDKTSLYIDDTGDNNPLAVRFQQHIADFTRNLQKIFKNFDAFPVPAREALLDMIFNLGPGRDALEGRKADPAHHVKAIKGHKASGLRAFGSLRKAAEASDWKLASENCHRAAPVSKERNDWTRNRFLEAVGWECAKPA